MTREERKKRERRRQILLYTGLGLMVVCVLGAVFSMTYGFFFPDNGKGTDPYLSGDYNVNSTEMVGFHPGEGMEVQAQAAPSLEKVEAFWEDAAFVGDSIIAGFGLYLLGEGQRALGDPTIIALTGYSLHDALQPAGSVSHPVYEGEERTIFEALSMRKPSKVVLSFGINDLGRDSVEQIVQNYDAVIRKVREVCPEAQIYVMSCTYVFQGREGGNRTNDNIRELNRRMEEYGEENQVGFINLAPYLADENGSLYSAYTRDFYVHLNEKAYAVWVQVLRRYAYWQLCGEEAPEEMFPIVQPAAVPPDQIPSGTIAYDPPEYTAPATAAPPVWRPETVPATEKETEESVTQAEETEENVESQPASTEENDTSAEEKPQGTTAASSEGSPQNPGSSAAAGSSVPSSSQEGTQKPSPAPTPTAASTTAAAQTPAPTAAPTTAAAQAPTSPAKPAEQEAGKENQAEKPAA